jgi:predicted AlkP superfamily pyrophosphatase or phosphodiesterase
MMSRYLLYTLLVLVFFFVTARANAQLQDRPYVVIISFDGFRWDFPKRFETPHLAAMAKNGVRAKAMIPCFPTKTFPNHYSMVTGLYPDHHGIVANKFYDTALKKTFSLTTPAKFDPAFYGGNPIWNVAEEQGVKTAVFSWPGSDVVIQGRQPSTWEKYNKNFPFAQRIDSVIYWLQLPAETRPHFIAVYFEEPDNSEHDFGPLSDEAHTKVILADSIVGAFTKRLNELPIASQVNFIVLSDHGLAEVSKERAVKLNDYIPLHWLALPAMGSPVVFLKAAEGYYDSIAQHIHRLPHVNAYPSSRLPERLHLGKNPRTLDFTLIAEKGWSIITDPPEVIKKGNHGFDNKEKNMHAIFYATGPAFKKGYVQKRFQNIDVYPLIAHILSIQIPTVDGNLKKIKNMLATKP